MKNETLLNTHCKRCGYKWIKRTEHPKRCPSCESIAWWKDYEKRPWSPKEVELVLKGDLPEGRTKWACRVKRSRLRGAKCKQTN